MNINPYYVTDAPEVQVEEAYILTDMEEEQEIVCIVDSSPEALQADLVSSEHVHVCLHEG